MRMSTILGGHTNEQVYARRRQTVRLSWIGLLVLLTHWAFVGCVSNGSQQVGEDSSADLDSSYSDVFPDVLQMDAAVPIDCSAGDFFIVGRRWPPLESLYLLQPPTVTEGQTVRIAMGVQVGDCEQLGGIDYFLIDAITIQVAAIVYENGSDHCPGYSRYEEHILVLSDLTPGPRVVSDYHVDVSGQTLSFTITPCAGDCWCQAQLPKVGYGESCTYDCDCSGRPKCLGYESASQGWLSACYYSCTNWYDCPEGHHCDFSADDVPLGHCVPETDGDILNECTDDGDCPEFFQCYYKANGDHVCVRAHDFDRLHQSCECDAECGGLKCVDYPDGYNCQHVCLGDRECGLFEQCSFIGTLSGNRECIPDE